MIKKEYYSTEEVADTIGITTYALEKFLSGYDGYLFNRVGGKGAKRFPHSSLEAIREALPIIKVKSRKKRLSNVDCMELAHKVFIDMSEYYGLDSVRKIEKRKGIVARIKKFHAN